jgi:sporulation protein YlmC with PRC-barrel domain
MKRALLLGGAVAAMLGAAPLSALADDAIISNTPIQLAQDQPAAEQVDAGNLVGQEVYDGNGNKVGDIDSVMVDQSGKVSSVVVDVSDWLESEKLIAVNWSDLQMGQDGRIVTSMTKESAQSAAAFQYKDENLRGQVMTESGERSAAAGAGAGGAAGATTGVAADSALMNPDGSLNASKLIGLDVQSPQDQKVGDIGEVVVSKDGQVEGVVVDVGGFLGIATHPVLLDWKDVGLTSENGTDRAVINLNKQRLEQMPAYQSSSR